MGKPIFVGIFDFEIYFLCSSFSNILWRGFGIGCNIGILAHLIFFILGRFLVMVVPNIVVLILKAWGCFLDYCRSTISPSFWHQNWSASDHIYGDNKLFVPIAIYASLSALLLWSLFKTEPVPALFMINDACFFNFLCLYCFNRWQVSQEFAEVIVRFAIVLLAKMCSVSIWRNIRGLLEL